MIVEADADVVFLDELFDRVDRVHGLGGDAVKPELFGELKNFPRLGLIFGDADDAVIDGADAVLLRAAP